MWRTERSTFDKLDGKCEEDSIGWTLLVADRFVVVEAVFHPTSVSHSSSANDGEERLCD